MATFPSGTLPDIHCCMCGQLIQPNQANMCIQCLKDRVDITEGLSRSETIICCTFCERYRGGGPGDERWLVCEPESTELLALCLKQIGGLGKGKGKGKTGATFVDANWIWTEPHSKRLKILITVEKEVLNGATVRQKYESVISVHNRQCKFCAKEATDHNWTTIIQVRQQVSHKRTLLALENRLLKDGAAKAALRIVPAKSGLDFYFSNRTQAIKFAEQHVLAYLPTRRKESKALIGADMKSNKHHFRHTLMIEVVPICRHDLIILPKSLQKLLFGGRVGAVVVENVTKTIGLVDPTTKKRVRMSETKYWQNEFKAVATSRDMVKFLVLDVQPLDYSCPDSDVEVTVVRESDEAMEEQFVVVSHIGEYLNPDDTCLGYDFTHSNLPDNELQHIPSVTLVQKINDKPMGKKEKPEPKPGHVDEEAGKPLGKEEDQVEENEDGE